MNTTYLLRAQPDELLRSLPLNKKPEDYDGGLSVSKRLQKLLQKPGYIKISDGGEEARGMYVTGTGSLNPERLSPFGLLCFTGAFETVKKAVDSGVAPPLSSTETPYKLGYATMIIFGAQQFAFIKSNDIRHLDTLTFLIDNGLALDTPDIVGWTAISHAASAPRAQTSLMKVLIEGGADLNHRSRFGDVPLLGAFMRNNVNEADLLLEHGADLDIPDADGVIPRTFCVKAGPQITAIVQKHINKRSGTEAPRTEKSCDTCRKKDVNLSRCSKCRVARYCSTECQRSAWREHKRTCVPFSDSNTLTFKPFYSDPSSAKTLPIAQLTRSILGEPTTKTPAEHMRAAHVPKDVQRGMAKDIIIKVQVALGGQLPMLVYDKRREFVCQLRRADSPDNFDKLEAAIRAKGVMGLKAYFAAELRNRDELVIKVSEILAEQPF